MSFTQIFKKKPEVFKLAQDMLKVIATENKIKYDILWSQVSSRDEDHIKKHHRKERKRDDPLAQIKRHRTAFSFFTQDHRNAISQKNKNLSFGQVSKLVGEEWRGLDDKTRAKYKKLEVADRKRYNKAREEIMKDLASKQVEATTEVVVETAPVETTPVSTTTTTTKSKSSKSKRATRGKK